MLTGLMRKTALLLSLLMLGITATAQTGGINPYSIYGLGWSSSPSYVHGQTLGRTSSSWRSGLHVNPAQPASYSELKYTTLDIGGYVQMMHQADDVDALWNNTGGFREFGLGLPLGNGFGMAVGLRPHTTVGYDILSSDSSSAFGDYVQQYQGSGGLNETFVGIAYAPAPWLSVGINGYYRFGSIERSNRLDFVDNQYDDVKTERRTMVSDWTYDAGIQLVLPVGNNVMTIGATYSPTADFDAWQDLVSYAYKPGPNGSESPLDSVVTSLNKAGSVRLPGQIQVGLSLEKQAENLPVNAWEVHAGYTLVSQSELLTFATATSHYGEDVRMLSLSAGIIPALAFTERKLKSYGSQVSYTASFTQANTGLIFDDQSVNQWNLTTAMALPIGGKSVMLGDRKFATVNLGLQVGKLGEKDNGLLRELQFRALLGVTLNDQWFVQFKYR